MSQEQNPVPVQNPEPKEEQKSEQKEDPKKDQKPELNTEQSKDVNQPKDVKEKKELPKKEESKEVDKENFFNVININMKSNISAILLSCEKIIQIQNRKEIHLNASGNAIFKLVTIAEILKNLYPSLIHNTYLSTHSSKNIKLEIVISEKEPEGKIIEKISDEKKNELIKIWQNSKFAKNGIKKNNNTMLNRYGNGHVDRRIVPRRFIAPQNRGMGYVNMNVNRGGFMNGNRWYGNGIRNRWQINGMIMGNRWQGNVMMMNRNWRNNNGNWNNRPIWNNRRFMIRN